MVDGGKHRPLVDELHHRLGGVDVHVHHVEGQVDVEDAAGELALELAVGVGLLQGGGEEGRADHPAAAEEGLHGPGAPAGQGRGDIAPDGDVLPGPLHRHQGHGEVPAPGGVDGGEELPVPGGVELLPAVTDVPQGELRAAEGDLRHQGPHGGGLGGVGLHELQPGGGVEKELPDGDGGALRAPGGLHLPGDAPLQVEAGPGLGPPLPGDHVQAADGGDGRQSLAPEAQGADSGQVLGRAELAGGVAEKGGGQLPGGDAAAVVGDPDQGHAAGADLHRHSGGPGVDGVLDELLDHAGGPLHHLAGGDQVRHMGGELLDMGHFCYLFLRAYVSGIFGPVGPRAAYFLFITAMRGLRPPHPRRWGVSPPGASDFFDAEKVTKKAPGTPRSPIFCLIGFCQ